MLLDLSRLRGGVERLDRRFEPSEFSQIDGDFRVVAPVVLTGDVRKDDRKVRLTGRVQTALECACSRCLEPFTVPIDAAIDLLLLPASENAGDDDDDDEREVEQDDLGVSYYADDVIDLGEIVREQFYLALPMKPLCREDCQGLCPVCGVNRNRETCECEATWVDPRMEGLRSLNVKK